MLGWGHRGKNALFCLMIIALVSVSTTNSQAELTPKDITALQERAAAEGWTFEVGENDATKYSLDQLCGFKMPDNWQELAPITKFSTTAELPSTYDWRDLTGLPPVRNQGGCGSCWAFSTVGALECAIRIKDGVDVNLSEQWLVSCNTNGWGCNGGFFAHDYHEWKTDPCNDFGAVLETDFPYTATDAACNCPYPHPYTIENWAYIGNSYSVPSVDAIKQAIMEYGPVSVAVYANSAMQAYNGGIFNGCESAGTNHAVVLVGWDDNQGTNGVWFMRNSWGAGWGEDGGYMRIGYGCSRIGEGACYIDYGPLGPMVMQDDLVVDDGAGDGNGRPDPGETGIEILVTLTNFGQDALGLTITATASDPEIVFSNATSSLGDVLRWEQTDNTADPIAFAVDSEFPPTIVQFELTYSANGGDYTKVETFDVNVGQPQFFIVDDDQDNSGNYEQYYTAGPYADRIPFVVWGKDSLGTPPADTMAAYPYTIWFTGDHRLDVLSSADVTALTDFLDGGGRLFLTGQDIAADLSDDADSTFLVNYLHARFAAGDPLIMTNGVAGDPITDGHLVAISGSGGAANQSSPDIIVPVDTHASTIYTYYGSSDVAGVRVTDGDYRLVFLPWGFEGVADDLGYTTRAEIFGPIIDWLSITGTTYVCGDVNSDLAVNPVDVVLLVNFVYKGGDPPAIVNSGDVNTDCAVNPVDVVFMVNFVYKGVGTLLPGCVE